MPALAGADRRLGLDQDKRQEVLKALMAEFPSWDAKVEVQLRKEDTTDRNREENLVTF